MDSPTPKLQALVQADPDLVDRIFDYIVAEFPEFREAILKKKPDVRAEFRDEECYIAGVPATDRQKRAAEVLAMFNGRNTSEVARRLQISKITVWRYIKQARQSKA